MSNTAKSNLMYALQALSLAEADPAGAAKYLTDLTISRMEKLVKLCRELRKKLLTKYSGDVV